MQREILKTKTFVDTVPNHPSLPHRFCYESYLKLFVYILQPLPSFLTRRIFAMFVLYRWITCLVRSPVSSLLGCHFPWLWEQSSTWLYPCSPQQAMRSSFWWPRNCCKSSLSLRWLTGKLLEAALVEHGTPDSPLRWINTRAAVSWRGVGTGRAAAAGAALVPNSSFTVPSSLCPAPKSTASLVTIAWGSAITSIKQNDPG